MNTSNKKELDLSNLSTRELNLLAAILEILIAEALRTRIDDAQRAKLAPAKVSRN